MTELLEQYLRLGLVHFMAYPETIKDESLLLPTAEKVATDPMFRFLEIKAIEDRSLVEPLRRMAASAGIGLGLAAQPAMLARRLDPGSAERKEKNRALKVLRHQLDQACALGAESLALLSGPDPGEENKRAEALSRTADFLAELCDHSLSAGGPVIVLEVFDRSVDKKALVGPAETAARLCDLVYARGAENFGVLVNLAHLPLLGETPYDALVPVADYLKAARLGNAVLEQGHPLYGDQHPGFGTAGGANKVGQVRDFIHMLKNIGFLNRKEPPVVSLEVKPSAGETGDWVVACAKRVLLRAWALA
ncbi:MAG: TIM barrel protein [Candidatus Glassbacteria bacterium]|nr:TIM barrel protein [Candidatus Glassbacteria bacterium]